MGLKTGAIATVALLAACSGEAGSGALDGRARWKPAGAPAESADEEPGASGSGPAVHIDLNSLRMRGDTVRVRTRVIQGNDTTLNDVEIACSTRMLRRIDIQETWRPAPRGLAGRIAAAACEELTTR